LQRLHPEWEARLITNGEIKRRRVKRMSIAEIMTIIISFHQYLYRDFKNYYLGYVAKHLKSYLTSLLSYTSFIEVVPSVIIPLEYLYTHGKPYQKYLEHRGYYCCFHMGINCIWNDYWVTYFVPNIKNVSCDKRFWMQINKNKSGES
jgi:hypothetical protein